MLRIRRLLPLALLLALAASACGSDGPGTAGPGRTTPATASVCDRVAAQGGDDGAVGTARAPFATPARLAAALTRGQTGCVRGVTSGDVIVRTDGVTLTSEPGGRGTVRGELIVDAGADRVTISDLDLDGSPVRWPTPAILGDDARLVGNDITSRGRHICVLLGLGERRARAERVLVAGNRIHDCGTSNNQMHGIYVQSTAAARIVGNDILDNGDRGIQLFPDAQDTEVAGNVIDGNGQGIIFSGTAETASSGNRVHHNVISNPRLRAPVESFWDGPVGRDNVVERNCLFGGRHPEVDPSNGGFVARGNVVEEPRFADRARGDLRLVPGTRCAAILAAGRRAAVYSPAGDPPTEGRPTP